MVLTPSLGDARGDCTGETCAEWWGDDRGEVDLYLREISCSGDEALGFEIDGMLPHSLSTFNGELDSESLASWDGGDRETGGVVMMVGEEEPEVLDV